MAKIDRQYLRNLVNGLQGISAEDRSQLLQLVNEQKRYGLVWEDKPEEAEQIMKEKLPIIEEVEDKRIINDTSEEKYPNHIIIEGDNLHALTTLCYTHEGKIDVIYIDPPYNTGAKDWRYNNDFVDELDSYRHSKWLSFMSHRLRIAKRLLTINGIIVCAIDHHEIFSLGLLMDDIFGEENRLGIVAVVHKSEGRNQEKFFGTSHEYALFYSKNKIRANFNNIALSEEVKATFTKSDESGLYRLNNYRRDGGGGHNLRQNKPNFWYPIYVSKDLKTITLTANDDYLEILPITNTGQERTWKTKADTFSERLNLGLIVADYHQGRVQIFEKYRENQVIKTHWTEPKYHAIHYGTKLLEQILGSSKFNFPKSLYLIQDTLKLSTQKDALILDFFAGSGTTLHATMQLNNEDGGNRQCILVTNNENNICEEVTYERNKRVIQGYTNQKGESIEGLKKNNLRYYKIKAVGREKTLKNKKTLVALSCGMLNIKENIYKEENTFGSLLLKKNKCRYFSQGQKQMLVIIDEEWIAKIVEQLKNMEVKEPIKIYVFSNSGYAWDDDFYEVRDKVEPCALPEAIYNAYKHILPEAEDKIIDTGEEKTLTAEQEEELLRMYEKAMQEE